MPVPRDPTLPQINAGQALYGAIPIGLLPNGTSPGQIPYWDGVQWNFATLVAQAGIDIDWDAAAGTLNIVNSDYRIPVILDADAILQRIEAGTFSADAVLV